MAVKDRLRRNMVLVPGADESKIQMALADSEIDSVILDLEDLVAPNLKAAARKRVQELIESGVFQEKGVEIVVRINHPDTPYFLDDIREMMAVKPDMLRIPKVESRDDVLFVDRLVRIYEQTLGYEENTVYLMSAIESAKGVINAYEIASACPRMIGMALSSADYAKDLKVVRTKESTELDWARGMLINSARAAGVFVMDTSFTFPDLKALEKESRRAKAMGFDGKTSIMEEGMPGVINKAFTPSDEEIALAQKVLSLEEQYKASDAAFIIVDGLFLDKPIVEQYRRLLRAAGKL